MRPHLWEFSPPPNNAIKLWIHQWVNRLIQGSQRPHDTMTSQWLDPISGDIIFNIWIFGGQFMSKP
jgi:hypothetical protein